MPAGYAEVVGGELFVADDLASRARGAPAEERGVVLEDPGGGNERVRAVSHALERGRVHERGPASGGQMWPGSQNLHASPRRIT